MFHINTMPNLVAFFNGYKGQCRATLTICTEQKMNKKDVATKKIANPYEKVLKFQTLIVDLNVDYEEKVNDARMLEGQVTREFEAEQRKWGVHINKSIVEKDEGKFYLQYVEIGKEGHATYELEDGTKVNWDDFGAFVPSYSGSVKQNLVDQVQIRTVKLENVIGLNIDNKVEYVIVD
jgi:hypothetical protein